MPLTSRRTPPSAPPHRAGPAGARGFTLIELLVAMVMLSLVGVVVVRMMRGAQRLTTEQAARAALQGNTRGGALLMPAELREIDPAGGDIVARSDTSIRYRAARGFGVICNATASGGTWTIQIYNITSAASNTAMRYNGVRTPSASTDYLVVLDDGDQNTSADDAWVVFTPTAVSTTASCPDGSPAYQFTATAASTPITASGSSVWVGAPLRVVEDMLLSSYTDGSGQVWLAAKSMRAGAAASFQPVLGPLDGTQGLQFRYFRADGAAATGTTDVRGIEVMVRGMTDRAVQRGLTGSPSVPRDSQTVRIALRNAP